MERICQNCGAPIPQGAKFCVRCGKTVESLAASPVDAKSGKPSSAKRVVLLAALGLVITRHPEFSQLYFLVRIEQKFLFQLLHLKYPMLKIFCSKKYSDISKLATV